jgi:geranylgeranyl diphosphate synthase type I
MSSAEEIKTEINFIASKINQFILSNVSGNPAHLYDASLHYIKSGGKRIRPFLSVKSCQLFGGVIETAIPYASSVELIHNLSYLVTFCFPNLFRLSLFMEKSLDCQVKL